MQKLAKLFLPLVLIFLSAFARTALAVNTVAIDPASVSITVNENAGQAGVIVRLTRDAGNAQVTVDFDTANHVALAGSDYFSATGTLIFAPNETAKLVQISIINDFIPEPAEDFYLNLSNPSNAMITTGQSTITIADDDGSVDGIDLVSFSAADYGTVETLGPGRGPGVISLILNAQRRGDPNRPLTVEVTVGQPGDTAIAEVDYIAPATTTHTFPPGVDQIIVPVQAIDRPDVAQGNLFFTAVLTSPDPFISIVQPAIARGTIFDNAGFNTVRLLSDTFRVQENSQFSFSVPVFRTGSFDPGGTNVSYKTEIRKGDTAVEGVNFLNAEGTLNFAPLGDPVSDNEHVKFITIFIPNNELIEGDVTFHLTLTFSDVAQLGPVSTTQVIVGDDDLGNVVQFSSTNYSVGEAGGFASVTVNLIPSGDPSKSSVVDFSASSITAFSGFDFSPINTTLVFQPGEFTKTIQIPVLEDSITEPSETFRVTLSNPGAGTLLGTPSTSVVTILDNDLSNIIQFVPTDYTVAENNSDGVTLTVFADRANNPSDTITVSYKTVANTATSSVDYTKILSGTARLRSGRNAKNNHGQTDRR